jgi:hypothetical protein
MMNNDRPSSINDIYIERDACIKINESCFLYQHYRELYLTRKLMREQRANYKKHSFISVDILVNKRTP